MSAQCRRLAFENLERRRLLAAVAIPSDLQAAAGSEIAAPITIDSAAGLRGAEIRLAYDPTLLDLQESDITAGSIWASSNDTQVVVNLNAQTGEITIFVSAPQSVTNLSGSLVTLGFKVRAEAAVGSEAVIDLIHVRLNEGAIPVTPAPVAGNDSTDGRITVTDNPVEPGPTDQIAGTVYADANNDHAVGPGEGLPGVTITLVNTVSGQTYTSLTDAQGQFQFTDLPAGQYRLVQTQPAAYIDGGNNEIAVTLAAGANQSGHDFRELGLRAAYLGNRLAATSALPAGGTGWTEALRQIQTHANPPVAAATASASANDSAAPASLSASSLLASSLSAEGEGPAAETHANAMAAPPLDSTRRTDERDDHAAVDQALQDGLW